MRTDLCGVPMWSKQAMYADAGIGRGSVHRNDLGGLVSATRVLEVVIAMTFMFYLAALLSSGLVEWLANLMKKRAKYLLRGLRAMLEGNTGTARLGAMTEAVSRDKVDEERELYTRAAAPEAGDDLFDKVTSHPLILGLAQSKPDGQITRLPSYVPARLFVTVLFDELPAGGDPTDTAVKQLKTRIDRLADRDQLKKSLQALLRTHGDDLDAFTKAVEGWYEDQMDRISGAYKRWAKRWIVVVGVGIALVMHLDAIGLASHLWTDEPARAAIVEAIDDADACPEEDDADARAKCIDDAVALVALAGPPIGPQAWFDDRDDGNLALVLVGILLTGAASSLGAPFWFDALGRLNSLRNSGPKPGRSKDD